MTNIEKAREAHALYVTIRGVAQPFRWRDFTLQKGHVWGYCPSLEFGEKTAPEDSMSGYFVVYKEMTNSLLVYACLRIPDRSTGMNRWRMYAMNKRDKYAQVILDVLHHRRGGVVFQSYRDEKIPVVYKNHTENWVDMGRHIPNGGTGRHTVRPILVQPIDKDGNKIGRPVASYKKPGFMYATDGSAE